MVSRARSDGLRLATRRQRLANTEQYWPSPNFVRRSRPSEHNPTLDRQKMLKKFKKFEFFEKKPNSSCFTESLKSWAHISFWFLKILAHFLENPNFFDLENWIHLLPLTNVRQKLVKSLYLRCIFNFQFMFLRIKKSTIFHPFSRWHRANVRQWLSTLELSMTKRFLLFGILP